MTPYFWDSSCKLGDLGCLADSDLDETMASHGGLDDFWPTSVMYTFMYHFCKSRVTYGEVSLLHRIGHATFKYSFGNCKQCIMIYPGCHQDVHIGCRFCGVGDYASITCPPSACLFSNEPWCGDPVYSMFEDIMKVSHCHVSHASHLMSFAVLSLSS